MNISKDKTIPFTRNSQFERLKIIDKLLAGSKRYSIKDLISIVSTNLNKPVSKRTIQNDIKLLKDAYNVPLPKDDEGNYLRSRDGKYKYVESGFSILNHASVQTQTMVINQLGVFMDMFNDFGISNVINRLAKEIKDLNIGDASLQSNNSFIKFETVDNLKGKEWMPIIFKARMSNHPLKISYKSFQSDEFIHVNIEPSLIKEFNNRWYVIGQGESKEYSGITRLGLDRIVNCTIDEEKTIEFGDDALKTEFSNLIGITKYEDTYPQNVVLKVKKNRAPYIITKPIHHSQKVIDKNDDFYTFNIFVYLNKELENHILSFGSDMEVLEPKELRESIREKLQEALGRY